MARKAEDTERKLVEPIHQQAAWFGGAFEIGGSPHFFIQRQNGKDRYSYPRIALHDSEFSSVRRLKDQFTGVVGKDNKDSWRWSVAGGVAVLIVQSMERFAPSRSEYIHAVSNWADANSLDERVEIAKDMRGHHRLLNFDPVAYEELVTNLQFVAGVIDNSARPYFPPTPKETKIPDYQGRIYINIYDSNKPLLCALSNEYGGDVFLFKDAGSEFNFRGRASVLQNDTYQWRIASADSRKLVTRVRPYLVWRKDEIDRFLKM